MRYSFRLGAESHKVTLEEHADGPKFKIGESTLEPEVTANGDGAYTVNVDGESFTFQVRNGRIEDTDGVMDLEITRARPELIRAGGAGRRGDGRIKPPMPGKVVEVPVKVGQSVAEGDVVVVLEAMKMQNDLKTPIAGTVSKVHVQDGQNVEATTILVEIEPEAAE